MKKITKQNCTTKAGSKENYKKKKKTRKELTKEESYITHSSKEAYNLLPIRHLVSSQIL